MGTRFRLIPFSTPWVHPNPQTGVRIGRFKLESVFELCERKDEQRLLESGEFYNRHLCENQHCDGGAYLLSVAVCVPPQFDPHVHILHCLATIRNAADRQKDSYSVVADLAAITKGGFLTPTPPVWGLEGRGGSAMSPVDSSPISSY